MNPASRTAVPLLLALSLLLGACNSPGQLSRISEMDDLQFDRMQRSIASYAQVSAWGAVSEGWLEPFDVELLATNLEELASRNLVAGVTGFFVNGLEGSGWQEQIVFLLATNLDIYLEERGFWDQITPRTQSLILAIAAALRQGAGTQQQHLEAEKVRLELEAQGAPPVELEEPPEPEPGPLPEV